MLEGGTEIKTGLNLHPILTLIRKKKKRKDQTFEMDSHCDFYGLFAGLVMRMSY